MFEWPSAKHQRDLEQAVPAAKDWAKLLFTFYTAAIEYGFNVEQAFLLTLAWQTENFKLLIAREKKEPGQPPESD